MTKCHTTPKHLRPETQKWVRSVMRTWQLEQHHVKLLVLAAESFDRACEARETLATSGLTYIDKRGIPRAHPAVNIERDAKVIFARLLRELALDVEPPAESRPPTIRR